VSYTAKQLEYLLEGYSAEEPWEYTRGDGTVRSGIYHYESWDGLEEQLDRVGSFARIDGIGEIQMIENIGGEGQGDYAAMVFKVTAPDGTDRLFRKEGYYASYDGTTWDGDFAEVEAYEKTVTDYREISK
jgi:hypothetical protein